MLELELIVVLVLGLVVVMVMVVLVLVLVLVLVVVVVMVVVAWQPRERLLGRRGQQAREQAWRRGRGRAVYAWAGSNQLLQGLLVVVVGLLLLLLLGRGGRGRGRRIAGAAGQGRGHALQGVHGGRRGAHDAGGHDGQAVSGAARGAAGRNGQQVVAGGPDAAQLGRLGRRAGAFGVALQEVGQDAGYDGADAGAAHGAAAHGAGRRGVQLLGGEPALGAGAAVEMQAVEQRDGVEDDLSADLAVPASERVAGNTGRETGGGVYRTS